MKSALDIAAINRAQARREIRAARRNFRSTPPNHRMPAEKKADVGGSVTRQQRRAACFASAWDRWRCYPGQVPTDDRGPIKRKTRRSMAHDIAILAFNKIQEELKPA